MRFILKSAFWLGLLAFFIPFGGEPKETSANVTAVGLFLGAQQALQDVTGFCERAPMACETGRELGVFAGERIGDGIEMASALFEGRLADGGDEESDVAASKSHPRTDPIATGAIATGMAVSPLPAPYVPPKRRAAETTDAVPRASTPSDSGTAVVAPVVPTPAPRI